MTTETVPSLVEPEWLEARLETPDVRVVDCTLHLSFDSETGDRQSESGRSDWERAHIPGSVFADIQDDLSAADPEYPYQRPTPERFADAMEALGIGDDSRVVLYDAAENIWAARAWWLLRAFGFDRAGILNGGWKRWTAEDRPISTAPPTDQEVTFTPEPRPELFVDKETVLEAIDDDSCCLVNALRPADHAGTGLVKYGRPGRIPDSVNVPAIGDESIVGPADNTYLPRPTLRERFADVGVIDTGRVITYCGGGIAASNAAFALHLLGRENVAVYDGSLAEWGRTDLPMETD
ncbi:sulfurtransferase [Natronorubrum tibetense]|uniref:Thiosulfate sulfurtransferase n=1 Tax=Natronorubrum tibetense GA33 TaxID=1114856 RepID=L9VKY8_9EURY|nr:sulfurtransferase [Natronorubrum tibetense]ELY37731.1 thiosulfate sulfurtransferase [Natronorubrum tibetense GA33]